MSSQLLDKIKDHLSLFDRLAARRFPDSALADEAVVYALDTLQRSRGRHLAAFAGRSRFSTYLGVVIRRLFEDFSRAKFGRLRPPAWISRLGGWWLVLYRLLCQERLPLPAALATMENYERASRFDSETAAQHILAEVTDCGRQGGEATLTSDGDMDLTGDDAPGRSAAGTLEARQGHILFHAIFQNFIHGEMESSELPASFARIFEAGLTLTSEERLLLKLCFQDDLSVSEAARLLDLTVHQAHGKMRRLLARLRQALQQAGLADELILLLRGAER